MTNTYLREITYTDLPTILEWRQDQENYQFLADSFRYTNIESEQRWFEHYMQSRMNEIRLAICLQKDDQHVGNVYLLNINSVVRSAEFHIFIGDKSCQNKGVGTLAMRSCLDHGFKDKNLQRIYLQVLENNIPAQKLYKKYGFKTEGILRNAAFKNGRYENLLMMALLRDEYV